MHSKLFTVSMYLSDTQEQFNNSDYQHFRDGYAYHGCTVQFVIRNFEESDTFRAAGLSKLSRCICNSLTLSHLIVSFGICFPCGRSQTQAVVDLTSQNKTDETCPKTRNGDGNKNDQTSDSALPCSSPSLLVATLILFSKCD